MRRNRESAAKWVPSCTAVVQLHSEAGSISGALRNAVPMLMPMGPYLALRRLELLSRMFDVRPVF